MDDPYQIRLAKCFDPNADWVPRKQRGGRARPMAYLIALVVITAFGAGFYFDRWLHRPIELPASLLSQADDEDENKDCPHRGRIPQTAEEWDMETGCVRMTPDDDDVSCTFTGTTCSVTL